MRCIYPERGDTIRDVQRRRHRRGTTSFFDALLIAAVRVLSHLAVAVNLPRYDAADLVVSCVFPSAPVASIAPLTLGYGRVPTTVRGRLGRVSLSVWR